MGKHTAGPWMLEQGGRVLANPKGFKPTPHEPVFVVANNVYLSANDDEMIANAHLIAAAPELLELAQMALERIDAVPADTVLPTMPGFDRDWAEDVITKAKGKI